MSHLEQGNNTLIETSERSFREFIFEVLLLFSFFWDGVSRESVRAIVFHTHNIALSFYSSLHSQQLESRCPTPCYLILYPITVISACICSLWHRQFQINKYLLKLLDIVHRFPFFWSDFTRFPHLDLFFICGFKSHPCHYLTYTHTYTVKNFCWLKNLNRFASVETRHEVRRTGLFARCTIVRIKYHIW